MHNKIYVYLIVLPFVIWALDGININSIFKKNKIVQAKIIYTLFCFSLTYLTTNFIYDLFELTNFNF